MRGLEALGFTVLEGYGLTETSPVVTFNPINKQKPGSTGKPLPSAEIKIHKPCGRKCIRFDEGRRDCNQWPDGDEGLL